MNKRVVLIGLAAVVGLTMLGSRALSQDDKKPSGTPGGDQMKEMMEAWAKSQGPNEAHKKLEPLIGTWSSHTKVFMGGPDGPAMESTGETENKWILGGRFVQTTHKGSMMGMVHEGMGLTGYDRTRNVYVGMWIDNVSSAILTMKGSMDHATGKTLTMYGEMDEPMLNVIGRMVRYVTRIIDNDKHVFEIYDLHAGENYKVLEITYTRKK